MTRLAKRMCSAAAAAALLCGCILPAYAAEEEEARVLQYESAEPVSAVVVDAEYADVVLQPGQTDKITVESAADAKGEYGYNCTITDGTLTVKVDLVEPEAYEEYTQMGTFKVLSTYINLSENTITVTLPNKMYDSIRAETSHSGIQMRDVQSQTAWFAAKYGNIVLSGVQPQKLELESKYGNVVFDQAAVIRCEGEIKYSNIRGTIAGRKSSYSTSVAVEYGDSNLQNQAGDGVHSLAFKAKYGNIDVSFTA